MDYFIFLTKNVLHAKARTRYRRHKISGKEEMYFFPDQKLNTCKACTGFRRDDTSGIHKRQHPVLPKHSLTYRFAQLHSRMFSFSIRKHEKLPRRMNLQKMLRPRAQKAAVSGYGFQCLNQNRATGLSQREPTVNGRLPA